MDLADYLTLSDGEAVHFASAADIPWTDLSAASSLNELGHLVQYRWFNAVIGSSGLTGDHLDVASGSGYGTHRLSQNPAIAKSHGVELNPRHLHYARTNFPGVDFREGNCERLTEIFAPSAFAFVTSGQTIEHLLDPVAFVQGVATTLRDDGLFLLMTPTRQSQSKAFPPNNPWHIYEFSQADLKRLLSFYFEVVVMDDKRPCNAVFEELRIAGFDVPVRGNATYCATPKRPSKAAAADFKAQYLIETYQDIITQVQERLVDERRSKHFLKDGYHLIDLNSGFYPSELDKIWTKTEASFTLRPTKPGSTIAVRFSSGTKQLSRSVTFAWNGKSTHFRLNGASPETARFSDLSGDTVVRLRVEPELRPTDFGINDIRRLGILISGVQEL